MDEFPKTPEIDDVITFRDYRTGKITQGRVIEPTLQVILVSLWNEDGTGGFLWVPWLDVIVEKPQTFIVEGAQ